MREGGSIPAAEILMSKFKKPVILTGFIREGANIHAPNENMDLELFEKGIKVLSKIYNLEF
jgi:acetylornithine deacetylase/succinyl-diaminopimelate desuccinylase-like protein